MILSEEPTYSKEELLKEEWRCFHTVIYPQKYYKRGTKLYVSNLGRCKADDNIIKPIPKKNGYLYFHNTPLHRIVYSIFMNENIKGKDIDHLDRNRQNNRIDNLRICTRKENMQNPKTKYQLIKSFNKPEYIQFQKDNNIGRRWINNGIERKKLFPDDCEKYILNGWKYGYLL
jgi:hypothetical protein